MIATFDTHADLLAAVRRSSGWIKIPEEAVHRALLPALTHLHLDGTLKRLDALTLPEALDVIRQLADERERLINDIRTYVPPYRPRDAKGQHPEHGETGETGGGQHGST